MSRALNIERVDGSQAHCATCGKYASRWRDAEQRRRWAEQHAKANPGHRATITRTVTTTYWDGAEFADVLRAKRADS